MVKVVKSVYFQSEDSFEKELLDHTSRQPNFSAYVKQLIYRDMQIAQAVARDAHAQARIQELESLLTDIEQLARKRG